MKVKDINIVKILSEWLGLDRKASSIVSEKVAQAKLLDDYEPMLKNCSTFGGVKTRFADIWLQLYLGFIADYLQEKNIKLTKVKIADVVYNFSMYDELLDSSLDETGIEIVINILKERVEKYNETIFIITHRKEAATLISNNETAQDIPTEIITLVKQKGITKRVDYCV